MKARLFFADKYRLAETPYMDKMALGLLDILQTNYIYSPSVFMGGKELGERLRLKGGRRFREVVLYARTNLTRLRDLSQTLPLIPFYLDADTFIVAGPRGYRLTNDKDEIRSYRDTLHVRAVHGLMAVQAMNELLNEVSDNDAEG